MKLISLYIDNFGKFSDFSYDFSKKLNSIYEENGWGKTTLTVFVKSMIYGLSKNERQQYTPWKNLTSFGGYLILETKGREYRIERQFSPLKASNDVFRIYDLSTNKEIDSLSSNLGEEMLGLNEASFERSVFIPQKDLEEGFGSDIEAKLANLIGGTDDSQSFESAIEILKDKTKELKLNSKKGLIVDKKMELAQIEDEIEECNRRMEGLPLLQQQLEDISRQTNELVDEKKKISTRILNFTKTQDKRAKLEVVTKYEEDIRQTRDLLNQNNVVFNGHDISVDEVMSYRSKNKELITLRTEYEVKKSNTRASEKIQKLEKDITDVPDEETLEHITDQIMKYNNIKSVIAAHKEQPKERIKPKAGIVLTILSTIMMIIGVGLFVAGFFLSREGKESFGYGFIIAGIVVCIVSILGYIGAIASFIVTSQRNAALQVGGQVGAYDYEKIHLEEEIREFFGKYHIYSSDFTKNLFTVRTNFQRYIDAKADVEFLSNENKILENKIKNLENEIQHFLGQFNSSEVCKTNEEKIGELNTHLRKRAEIEGLLKQKSETLKKFIEENGLDVINDDKFNVDESNQKILEIDAKIDELSHQKATFTNKYNEYENEISMLDDYVLQKENVEKEIRSMEDEFRLLNLSMDFLTASQNSLLEKYVKPMKDSVTKYVSLLLKDTLEYSIDVNFKFQFVTKNGLKSVDSYSRGYQTIISLCMRLALIDCLYPNEKPFIILDDPFVNFDDEKLDLCKSLMSAISSSYQIIYFTCHDSRALTEGTIKTLGATSKPSISEEKQVVPKATSKPQVKAQAKTEEKPEALQSVKPAVKVQKKKMTPEDELLEDLTRVRKEDVKPTAVKPVTAAKRQQAATEDGALGPMAGRTQAKTTRTIKITKKN